MDFPALLRLAADQPLFETGFLLAGDVDPSDVRRQLSRWTRSGKLIQVRRGLYALAPPYRRVEPHPFLLANHLLRPSYVSLQSALAHYGLIPEHVPMVTSAAAARPGRRETPLGAFDFRHLRAGLFFGFQPTEVAPGQAALVAFPEKALLDLAVLTPGGDEAGFLEGLRLQNLERLDQARLAQFAAQAGSPKLRRAAAALQHLAEREAEEYEEL